MRGKGVWGAKMGCQGCENTVRAGDAGSEDTVRAGGGGWGGQWEVGLALGLRNFLLN